MLASSCEKKMSIVTVFLLLATGSLGFQVDHHPLLRTPIWNLWLFQGPCTETIVRTSLAITTVRESCGLQPATALPPCSARSLGTGLPTIHRSNEVQDETQPHGSNPDTANQFSSDYSQLGMARLLGLNKCPVFSTSVSSVTTTESLLISYTCTDSAASKYLPDYPICGSSGGGAITPVTCGTVPSGTLASCAATKRSLEYLEEFGPSNVYRIEATQLPQLGEPLVGGIFVDTQLRLASSFSDPATGSFTKQHYGIQIVNRDGVDARAMTGTTETVHYTCYGASSNLPDVPPCSPWEYLLDPKCFVFRNVTSGVITSPGYDGTTSYPSNFNGCWIIIGPPGTLLTISLVAFNTEFDKDIVKIYEGLTPSRSESPFLRSGSLGLEILNPDSIPLVTNTAFITFTSDSSQNFLGFNMTFVAQPPT